MPVTGSEQYMAALTRKFIKRCKSFALLAPFQLKFERAQVKRTADFLKINLRSLLRLS